MFDWLPEVCRDLRGNLVQMYWTLLVPYIVFLICLEFFRPDGSPSAGRILRRAVVSVILLLSFEECMNVIAMLSDGITDKISGLVKLKELLQHLKRDYADREVSWLKAREAILYIMNLIAYMIAYLGVYVADVLVHFVWSVLYIVSPLMILMYVSERTAFVTSNLYKGLINVVLWKILWSILAVLLLKMTTSPAVAADSENFLTIVLMNLCIGVSMLLIPMATSSLINDGMTSAASALSAMPTGAVMAAAKVYSAKFAKGGAKEIFSGFKGTRSTAAGTYRMAKTAVSSVPKAIQRSKDVGRRAVETFKARRDREYHPRPPAKKGP
ncbi:MAG: hypothetical protein JST16_03795 [Bdellovibrionales bacterium]|nr:hypothetical protein [Bdellovibrionales bacterium]